MSHQIKVVDQSIAANGGRGRRGESTMENPGPGFLKSGNYQFTLRPLTLKEYRYPGKNFKCFTNLFRQTN